MPGLQVDVQRAVARSAALPTARHRPAAPHGHRRPSGEHGRGKARGRRAMTTSLRLWPPICACHQRCTALSPACEHGAATLARLAGHERAVSQHPVFAGFPRRRLAVHRRLEGWAGRQSPGNAVLHRRGGRLSAHAVAGAPRPLPSKCSRPPTHGPQPGESFRRCVAESTAASLWIVCQLDGPLTHGPQPCRLARWRWCLRPCSPPTTSSFSALTNSWWAASPRCFLTMPTSTSRCAPDCAHGCFSLSIVIVAASSSSGGVTNS